MNLAVYGERCGLYSACNIACYGCIHVYVDSNGVVLCLPLTSPSIPILLYFDPTCCHPTSLMLFDPTPVSIL